MKRWRDIRSWRLSEKYGLSNVGAPLVGARCHSVCSCGRGKPRPYVTEAVPGVVQPQLRNPQIAQIKKNGAS